MNIRTFTNNIGRALQSQGRALAAAFLVLLAVNSNAQVATNYTFSSASNIYSTVLTGQTTIFPAGWSALVANVPLPFVFYFNGKGYSSVWVHSGGYITFGTTAPLLSANNPISNNNGFDGSVSAFGINNCGYSASLVDANNTSPIVYGTQTSGSNTVFVVQWSGAWRQPTRPAGGTENINFQIRLIENTNQIEIMYGTAASNLAYTYANIWSPVVGLGGASTSDFNTRENTATGAWTTTSTTPATSASSYVLFNGGSTPPSGLTMVWTPTSLPAACSGTPTVPAAIASTGVVCGARTVALSLSGLPYSTGLTYQWQQSATDLQGSYTDIATATNQTYVTTPTAATYYRCVVSCGADATTSSSVAVGRETACPANPTYTQNLWYTAENQGFGVIMASFSIPSGSNTCGTSFLDNDASASGQAQAYTVGTCQNYVDLTYRTPIKMQAGATYTGGTMTAGSTNAMYGAVWIDFNNDGTFAAAEKVSTIGASTNASSGNVTVTIPAVGSGAFYGLHRMRIRAAFGGAVASPTANIAGYGNTRDYLVSIMPPNQTVVATPVAAPASICAPGADETLTATPFIDAGTPSGAAYTYMWTGPSGFGSSVSSSTNTTSFTPTSTAFSGIYTVTAVSDGATACTAGTVNVIVATSVAAPTNPPASGLTMTGINHTGASSITFTPFATAPDGYLVVATNSATAPANPVDGTNYATGTAGAFGTESVVISGSVFASAPPYSTSALNANSRYYVYVYPFNIDCSGPKYYTGYPVLVNNTLTTCLPPASGLATASPTGTTVDLSWTGAPAGGNPTTVVAPASYTYTIHAYLNAGLTTEAIGYPVSGITGTSHTASGLSVGTTYYFVVTTDAPTATCGANSNAAVGTTLCVGLASTPLLQNFESSTLGNVSPNCWSGNAAVLGANGGGVYRNGGSFGTVFTPYSGQNYYLINGSAYLAIGTYANQWLMSPGLALTPGTYNVSFRYRSNSTWSGLKVQYTTTSTLPTNAMSDMAGATDIGTPLGSFSAGTWTMYSGTMTIGSAGTYYMGINAIMAPATCLNMAIEDIEICKVPNVTVSSGAGPYCAIATVNLSSAGSSDINQYSWTGPSGFTSTLANPTVSGLDVGVYTYSLTAVSDPISSGYGGYCSSGPATTTVTVTPGPDPITGTGAICPGASLTLGTTSTGGAWSSGSTSVATVDASGVVTGVAAGTAVISYTASCGGASTTIVTVNYPAGTILGTTLVCQGLTQQLTGSLGGGTWTSDNTSTAPIGLTTGIVSGMAVGTANITYSLGSCSVSAIVTVGPALPSVTGTLSVCPTTSSTLSNATVGGTWSSSNANATVDATSGLVTGATAGTSVITYTEGVCYTTAVMTVVPVPTAAPTVDAAICLGGVATLTANPGGSTNAYAWSGPSVAAASAENTTGSPTSAATYSLTVSNTSIAGCPTSSYTVAVAVDMPPVASPSNSGIICAGGTLSLTATPGGSTTDYAWSGPGLSSSTVANPTATPTVNVVYTLTVTNGTTNNGCSNSFTTAATVNPMPVAAPANDGHICVGGTVNLTANPSGGATTFNWSGATLSSASAENPTATPAATEIYSLTVSNGTTNPGCAPATVYTTSVAVNAVPTAAPSNDGGICAGGTVTLSANPANGAAAYTWTGSSLASASIENPTATPTATTIYTLVVSDGSGHSGCSPATAYTTEVTVDATPTAAPTNDGYICNGGTVNLTANPSATATLFAWTGSFLSSGAVENPTATPTVTAVYSLTVSDGTGRPGCSPATVYTTSVSVNATPAAAPSNDGPICVGGTVNLDVNAAGGATVYTWSGASLASTTAATPSATPGATEIYSVVVSDGSTQSGCSPATVYTTEVTVKAVPALTGASNDGPVCEGATLHLSADGASDVTDYSWTGPVALTGATTATPEVASATTAATGTYTVVVNNGTGSACSMTYTTAATVNTIPVATTITPSTTDLCVGSELILSAGSSTGSGTVVSYNWSGPDGYSAVTTVTTVSLTPATTAASGNYSLTVTYTGAGCTSNAVASTAVAVNNLPTVSTLSLSPTVICEHTALTLSGIGAAGAGSVVSYNWSGPNGYSSTSATSTQSYTIPDLMAAGNYTLTVTYTGTGCTSTAIISPALTVNPAPDAGTNTGTAIVCPGATTTLSNVITGGVWTSGATGVATVGTAGVVSGVTAGTAEISYAVTNMCGTDYAVTTVTVNPSPDAGTISGSPIACPGTTTTLNSTVAGGSWTSAATAIATVHGTTGEVTGVAAGTTTISYASTNSCGTAYATQIVTISPTPVAGTITGTLVVCEGVTITLGSTEPSGTWMSDAVATATVGSSSGIVTGVAAGTVVITYTNTTICGMSASTTDIVTVNPAPHAGTVTGTGEVCVGSTTTLASGVTGGVWSSGSAANATVSTGGVVTGVAAGSATISYSFTNSCGTDVATLMVAVYAVNVPTVTVTANPGATITAGTTVTFTATVASPGTTPTYKWLRNSVAIPGATNTTYVTSAIADADVFTCEVAGTGPCEMSSFNSVVMSVTSGVSTVATTALDVRVTPNPNKGEFAVKGSLGVNVDEEITLEVTDMLGRAIYTGKSVTHSGEISELIALDNTLTNGVYLLNVRTASGANKVFHIVVER